MPLLARFNFSSFFTFSCDDASYKIVNWTYADGRVVLVVDYTTDLEGREAEVTFAFNQTYIRYSPFFLNFTIKSNSVMLIIPNQPDHSMFLSFFFYLSVVAVVLLAAGSVSRKMVGVEIVTLLQVVYFLPFAARQLTPAMSALQNMSILSGSSLFLLNTGQNLQLHSMTQKVEFSTEEADLSLMIIALTLASLFLLFFLLFIISRFYGSNKVSFAFY